MIGEVVVVIGLNCVNNKKMPLECCCRCLKKQEVQPSYVTAKLLYRIAFTIWHVAFHIENSYVSTMSWNYFAKVVLNKQKLQFILWVISQFLTSSLLLLFVCSLSSTRKLLNSWQFLLFLTLFAYLIWKNLHLF